MRRLLITALVVAALTACGGPDAPLGAAESESRDTSRETALRRCTDERGEGEELKAAFATTGEALHKWIDGGQPRRWADDAQVSLCYFRGDDPYPAPGPPRPAKHYEYRAAVVPAGSGDSTLFIGALDDPPDAPSNAVRVDDS